MSKWINNKKRVWKFNQVPKPCHKLKFCPYGPLVEEYPVKIKGDKFSCKTFGHDCPVYYQAEEMVE